MIRNESTPPLAKKRKEISARARNVARKEKKATQAEVTVNNLLRNSRVSVEASEITDTKQLAAGTNIRSHKGKAKSKVPQVSESEKARRRDMDTGAFATAIEFVISKHDLESWL